MSNQLIPFASAEVPAHLAALFEGEDNILARASIDQLSYRGKTWRRNVAGEEVQLTRRNADGDVEPVSIVSLIVLDHNKGRSRAFYAGNYEEGKSTAPDCYSGDGVTPDASVKEPCAQTCATCPNSVKGSKITEAGKQSTACSPFKRVAVVPTGGVAKHPPMLLRLAQTSVWDGNNKDNEAKGWYAWDQYLDMLRARGAKHTAAVETKVKFDLSVAYPKLLFSAARWLNADEAVAAKARLESDADVIKVILSGDTGDARAAAPAPAARHTPAPADGLAEATAEAQAEAEEEARLEAQAEAARVAAEAAAAKKKAAAAKKKADEAAAAEAAAAELAAAQAAAAKKAQTEDDGFGGGDDGFGSADVTDVVAKPAAAAAKATPAAKATVAAKATPTAAPAAETGTPAGLTDLLAGWDD